MNCWIVVRQLMAVVKWLVSIPICIVPTLSALPTATPRLQHLLTVATPDQLGNFLTLKWAILWVFFPIDNALYSIAFGTCIKTAELIEMPFGVMSGLSPMNCVLHWSDDPQRGR